MMNKTLLLVEDESLIREVIADYFKMSDWRVFEAENGKEALLWLETVQPDLIILDIMMPQLDGFEVCRQVRSRLAVPIILLTAKSSDEDKIMGFELGADDYVTKPFSPKVLLARASALMKRVEGSVVLQPNSLKFGAALLNLTAHRLDVNGAEVVLAPKEYDLLLFLVRNNGIVLRRDVILNQIWGMDFEGDSRVVDSHIKKLRSKLGFEARHIRTVIGTGYKFEEES